MLKFLSENIAQIPLANIEMRAGTLYPYIEHLKSNHETVGYEISTAFMSLPGDEEMLRACESVRDKIGGEKLRYIVVVGIGGSSLGTKAVYEALRYKRPEGRKPEMLFLEAVHSDIAGEILRKVKTCESAGEVAVLVVSKSGKTTETAVNASFVYNELSKYFGDIAGRTVCITDEHSPLWELADRHGFLKYAIPEQVGGRFSVFSPAGLVPLALAGFDTHALLNGARMSRDRGLWTKAEDNPSLLSALLTFLHSASGIPNHNLFLFDPTLLSVGNWWRQLVGESLGKEYNLDGIKVDAGIMPIVSIGSNDLHSVGQLYLAGPKREYTTFVSVANVSGSAPETEIHRDLVFGDILPTLGGKTFSEVTRAILEGVKTAYDVRGLPYCEIILPGITEESIGELLQMKMMETMYLAKFMNVNAFDQPNVEEYKEEARKLLGL